MCISEVGGRAQRPSASGPTGKSFRFVRACVRSGCQVENRLKRDAGAFPFPFWPREAFP